jgi:hypothetical protein
VVPSIEFSDDDYNFLKAQAELEEVSLGEYVSHMVDRQRLIVKYQSNPADSKVAGSDRPTSGNVEAPHRKWGM